MEIRKLLKGKDRLAQELHVWIEKNMTHWLYRAWPEICFFRL